MMNVDPRPFANALLDMADERCISITNFSLNKILFFAHSDWLISSNKPLLSLSFEAWHFGPVLPVIYHQFKHCGPEPINSRATRISPENGESIIYDYRALDLDADFLRSVLDHYGRLPSSSLFAMSHIEGGPWDQVYNSNQCHDFGMTIPNELILSTALPHPRAPSRGKYVQ